MKSNQEAITKGLTFQRGVYQFLRFLFGFTISTIAQFKYKCIKPKAKTYLMLSNHTMNLDPLLMVQGTGRHIRFVANEKVMSGFWGWFVKVLAGPIPRRKGAPTDEVIETIEENLKAGISVGMLADGLLSWDGETGFISRKTAQLVKRAGVALVTYRFTGGYLKAPHWARHPRRGPVYGQLIHEYSAEDIAAMSEDEIWAAIRKDLYVNVYEWQREHMVRYKARGLAEGLELLVHVCPKCHRLGKLRSNGNEVSCDCGFHIQINEFGFFEGEDVPFEDALSWSRWQKNWFVEHAQELKQRTREVLLHNRDFAVWEAVDGGAKKMISEKADLKVYGDRMEIVEGEKVLRTLPMSKINKLGSFKTSKLMMTCEKTFYELSSEIPSSGYLYYGLWRVLSGREYE